MIGNGTKRRIRVAHVTLSLGIGGQEKLLTEFARHADRDRFDLHFVGLGFRGPVGEEIESLGWPVTVLEQRPGLRPAMILRLAAVFRQMKPDVVHTHDIKPLLYAAPAARMARVPALVHTKHCSQLPNLTSRQNALGCLAARLVDEFVCVSQDSARQTVAQGFAARRLRVIHNGIDLERFPYRGPNPAGPVATVARLSPEKDVENLIRAVALAGERHPALRLVIAGDGECRSSLEHLCRALGLQPRVEFLGEVRDIPALLARCRLFVLPSRTEGISLTLLEAMASGLPVLATCVGGNPEVVVDGTTGMLVPPNDPAALGRKMLELLEDDRLGRQLALAARQRVEQHFDIRCMVASYQTLYRGKRALSTTTRMVPA